MVDELDMEEVDEHGVKVKVKVEELDVGDPTFDEPSGDRAAPVRRPAGSSRPASRPVTPVASDEDLERMAHQLLFGRSGQPAGRLAGSALVAESPEMSSALAGPIDVGEVVVSVTEVAGVGATVADRLAQAGYNSAQALARVADDEVDDLAHEIGTFPGRVQQWVEHARALTR